MVIAQGEDENELSEPIGPKYYPKENSAESVSIRKTAKYIGIYRETVSSLQLLFKLGIQTIVFPFITMYFLLFPYPNLFFSHLPLLSFCSISFLLSFLFSFPILCGLYLTFRHCFYFIFGGPFSLCHLFPFSPFCFVLVAQYNEALRKAKTDSWKNFYKDVENSTPSKSFVKRLYNPSRISDGW